MFHLFERSFQTTWWHLNNIRLIWWGSTESCSQKPKKQTKNPPHDLEKQLANEQWLLLSYVMPATSITCPSWIIFKSCPQAHRKPQYSDFIKQSQISTGQRLVEITNGSELLLKQYTEHYHGGDPRLRCPKEVCTTRRVTLRTLPRKNLLPGTAMWPNGSNIWLHSVDKNK